MAKKSKSQFVCQECGSVYPRWAGKCDGCGAWNSITEEITESSHPKGVTGGKKGREIDFVSLQGESEPKARIKSGIGEFDRVCGGGLVAGSVLLVGGDPGIGKSTILLQVTAALANKGVNCAYISGEEAVEQVRIRARRLGLDKANVDFAAATNVRDIITTLDKNDCPDVVVIDSIQTMYLDTIESAPGTVSQVRAASHELIMLAKRRGFVLFLVGHVTKQGTIAGPRVLEHMVDTVLYFEGDRGHHFRILRGVKNRFGATDEIGVFEMTDVGLNEVLNPSALFLAERRGNVSGSCVFAGIEGTRPVLVEVQALVSQSALGNPRRAVVGWDSNRLSMVLAVLEARCGVNLAGKDIYLNIAGGLKISEPAADLAVATAVISAASDIPVPADMVVFGEIGLSGEVRAVAQGDLRLKEAEKLGFAQAMIPKGRGKKQPTSKSTEIKSIGHLQSMVDVFMG